MEKNLCKKVILGGGNLTPLIVPSNLTNGTGLMNPSIYNHNGILILNLRHVNYTLYHSESGQLFQNRFGPLAYLHPENDMHLRTTNFFCLLNDDFSIKEYCMIDTSKLDKEPLWDFVGLEDARIVNWDNKLFFCGVRRDTTTNGVGRMELSEIIVNEKGEVKEISRTRIEPPNNPNSYCEKNWMPILDMPYHFIKWTNPLEIVRVDMETKKSETVFLAKDTIFDIADLRGGSQVINYKNYRICVVHEVNLFNNVLGQKDGGYKHRFVIWDKNWNVFKLSEPFSFMDGEIEFSCGLTLYNNDLLVTFGFQDNAAYLLKIPENIIDEIVGLKTDGFDWGDNIYFMSNLFKKEIFEKKVYEQYYVVKENDIVMDIGANVGSFTYSISDKNPKHIYCIEPSNSLINTLIKNTSNNKNITYINKAISNVNTEKEIDKWINIYSHSGSTYETITFKKIIEDYNIQKIDFMKIDCEGGEYDIFTEENYDFIKNNINNIAGEWHLWNIEDGANKFKKFRDLYLKECNFIALTNSNEFISERIFDDNYIDNYLTIYNYTTQIMIYINNQ